MAGTVSFAFTKRDDCNYKRKVKIMNKLLGEDNVEEVEWEQDHSVCDYKIITFGHRAVMEEYQDEVV